MSENAAKATILVVEDDPDIARFIEVGLRLDGFDVAIAGDGEEGLEKTRAIKPDLVLTGWMMPKMLGIEMVKRLRQDPDRGETPIIMLTARMLMTDKVEGLAAGADDYLTKPFDTVETLLPRIKGLLRRKRQGEMQRPFFCRRDANPEEVERFLVRLAEEANQLGDEE